MFTILKKQWGLLLNIKSEIVGVTTPITAIEDDPNLTDKKFPGNPTRSFRTQNPLRVIDGVLDWEGHSPEELQKMRDHLDELKRLGIEAIND